MHLADNTIALRLFDGLQRIYARGVGLKTQKDAPGEVRTACVCDPRVYHQGLHVHLAPVGASAILLASISAPAQKDSSAAPHQIGAYAFTSYDEATH